MAVNVAAAAPSEKRLAAALQHRFFLRLHMTAILTATLLVGLLVTRVLYLVHLNIFAIRYAAAVIVAYGAFAGFIKVWLWYVEFCSVRARRRGEEWFDGVNFSSSGTSSFSGSSGGGSSSSLSGSGGKFGGGGATGGWDEGGSDAKVPAVAAVTSSTSSKKSGGGGGGSSDIGELILVVLIIALLVAIVASFAWIIYAAPTILSEAAFNAALAGALVRHAHTATHREWIGSVFRKTAIPFFLILTLSVILGWYAQHYCPGALRLRDAVHCANPAF